MNTLIIFSPEHADIYDRIATALIESSFRESHVVPWNLGDKTRNPIEQVRDATFVLLLRDAHDTGLCVREMEMIAGMAIADEIPVLTLIFNVKREDITSKSPQAGRFGLPFANQRSALNLPVAVCQDVDDRLVKFLVRLLQWQSEKEKTSPIYATLSLLDEMARLDQSVEMRKDDTFRIATMLLERIESFGLTHAEDPAPDTTPTVLRLITERLEEIKERFERVQTQLEERERDLHRVNEALATETTQLSEALKRLADAEKAPVFQALLDLVVLKDIKDDFGKTGEYQEKQPLAWASARAAIAEYRRALRGGEMADDADDDREDERQYQGASGAVSRRGERTFSYQYAPGVHSVDFTINDLAKEILEEAWERSKNGWHHAFDAAGRHIFFATGAYSDAFVAHQCGRDAADVDLPEKADDLMSTEIGDAFTLKDPLWHKLERLHAAFVIHHAPWATFRLSGVAVLHLVRDESGAELSSWINRELAKTQSPMRIERVAEKPTGLAQLAIASAKVERATDIVRRFSERNGENWSYFPIDEDHCAFVATGNFAAAFRLWMDSDGLVPITFPELPACPAHPNLQSESIEEPPLWSQIEEFGNHAHAENPEENFRYRYESEHGMLFVANQAQMKRVEEFIQVVFKAERANLQAFYTQHPLDLHLRTRLDRLARKLIAEALALDPCEEFILFRLGFAVAFLARGDWMGHFAQWFMSTSRETMRREELRGSVPIVPSTDRDRVLDHLQMLSTPLTEAMDRHGDVHMLYGFDNACLYLVSGDKAIEFERFFHQRQDELELKRVAPIASRAIADASSELPIATFSTLGAVTTVDVGADGGDSTGRLFVYESKDLQSYAFSTKPANDKHVDMLSLAATIAAYAKLPTYPPFEREGGDYMCFVSLDATLLIATRRFADRLMGWVPSQVSQMPWQTAPSGPIVVLTDLTMDGACSNLAIAFAEAFKGYGGQAAVFRFENVVIYVACGSLQSAVRKLADDFSREAAAM